MMRVEGSGCAEETAHLSTSAQVAAKLGCLGAAPTKGSSQTGQRGRLRMELTRTGSHT